MSLRPAIPILFGAFLLAGAAAHAGEVVDQLNRLRAPGGECFTQAPPLVANPMLDKAAAGLARGSGAEDALRAAGYRMTAVRVLTFDGGGTQFDLERMLPPAYCAQLSSSQLIDAGAYREGNRLWIVLAAPFAPKVGFTREQIASTTLALVNQARARPRHCGDQAFPAVRPVKWNDVLETVARGHAADMAANNDLSHTGRDGSQPGNRAERAGYTYRAIGENIAAGQLSPGDAVAGWIKSPPHCSNLMNSAFAEMGVAVAVDAASAQGAYWVQMFGTRLR